MVAYKDFIEQDHNNYIRELTESGVLLWTLDQRQQNYEQFCYSNRGLHYTLDDNSTHFESAEPTYDLRDLRIYSQCIPQRDYGTIPSALDASKYGRHDFPFMYYATLLYVADHLEE